MQINLLDQLEYVEHDSAIENTIRRLFNKLSNTFIRRPQSAQHGSTCIKSAHERGGSLIMCIYNYH